MSFKKQVISGVKWNGVSMGVVTILHFVTLAVLARILSPSDFGLMGMIMVVIAFVTMIADLGLGAAIIQRQDINKEQLSTFFFLNIILGIILCSIVHLFSGFIAIFFKKAELTNLLKVISFSFIIISIGQVFRTLLQKQLNFKTLAKVEVSGIAIYGIFSIFLAIKGFAVWSLIYGFLIRQIWETCSLWIISSFKPSLVFNLKEIKHLINFGFYVFGERIINYFNRNLDYIIIGRFLGSEALGFYTLAYQLMLFPISKISNSVTKVIFPAFSIIQYDNKKIRGSYLKIIKYISLVTFPMMAGLFVTAPEFINVIYGVKWQPTILILQIFCLTGTLQSIGTTNGTILYAKGRADISFKWNCFAVCCIAAAFVIGVKWGIVGVAIAYAVATTALFPIIRSITNWLIGLKWKDFLKQFINQTIGAVLVIMSVLCFKVLSNIIFKLSQTYILICSVLIGIIVYSLFIFIRDKKLIIEGLEILGIKKKLL